MEAKGIDKLAQLKVSVPRYGKGTFVATYLGEDNQVGYREVQGDLGEPFDPNYLEGTKQELHDYLFSGEIDYCKKMNTLANHIRKSGIIGSWDDKVGQFVVVRQIEKNIRTKTGKVTDRKEIVLRNEAYMWVDDETHEYVVDVAWGVDGSIEHYRGTHVREAISTALDWQMFNI